MSTTEEQKNKKTVVPKNDERCLHITEKGERCKIKKESESQHCHIHSAVPGKVLTKNLPEVPKGDVKPKKNNKKK